MASIARVEASSGSHLLGFDSVGAPLGDISNINVDQFTPVSNGGFVVEITENHQSNYQYQNIGDTVDQHDPVHHTYRKPVWYYVQTSDSEDGLIKAGDSFLISDKKELPEFIGENSKGLLIFSDGETFNTQNYSRGHFYNSLDLNEESIINAISQITSDDPNESIKEVIQELIANKTIEKTKEVSSQSGDNLLSISPTLNDVLIETTQGATASFSGEICNNDRLTKPQRAICKTTVIPALNSGVVSGLIGLSNKIKDLTDVKQILSIPDSKLTLLNTGLLGEDSTLDETFSGGWDGESALTSNDDKNPQSFVLSTSFNGQRCQDGNKQCLYSVKTTEVGSIGNKTTTLISDFVIDADTGFETASQAEQITGGQQDYLWVNDSYIVIKEAQQISIIDRADNNKLLAPVLPDTEIDTINLTDDNKLYITATESSGSPAAYIYDIPTQTMSNDISNGEKLHALKALIK